MSRDAGSIPAASTDKEGLREIASLFHLKLYAMCDVSHVHNKVGQKRHMCQITCQIRLAKVSDKCHNNPYLTEDSNSYIVHNNGIS
jgi:hypothetical protein